MKTAVVLFNLGGPDGPDAVYGFLRNLFGDPAILRLPWPLRPALAALIARRRAPRAQAIYAALGGRSPILPETETQAAALAAALGHGDIRVFVAMRYWHPMSAETARAVRDWGADRVVLLPLYPQFSTTTTQSSLAAWRDAARGVGLEVPTHAVCCYPEEPGFVAAYAGLIANAAAEMPPGTEPRVLFSAHGLPKRIVAAGDPYVWQVERSAAAIARAAGLASDTWRIVYQSRVGPLEWVGPSTEDEICAAGREGRALVVVPIAFVSEHSETLVELDIDYRRLAETSGVPAYVRVPVVGTHPDFIAGLKSLVARLRAGNAAAICSGAGGRLCPAGFAGCPVAQDF